MYLGMLAVMSSPSFVSPSDSTQYSLKPVNSPLLNPKKTLLPEPTGLTESKASYSVATSTATFEGVSEAPPDKRNCVFCGPTECLA